MKTALAGLVFVLFLGCGRQSGKPVAQEQPSTPSAPPVAGSPIPEQGGAQDAAPLKLAGLAGRKVFFHNPQFEVTLGVSFYEDGTWRGEKGRTGRYQVDGATLLVIDDAGEVTPHKFPSAEVKLDDEVIIGREGKTSAVVIAGFGEADTGPPPKVETVDEPDEIDGYKVVGFDALAGFKYRVPDDPVTKPEAKAIVDGNKIPEPVMKLNRQKVAIRGYMLSVRTEEGMVTEFLALRDQTACCFGAVPRINEWISVRMVGKGVRDIKDIPIYFFGTLKVGPVLENDYVVAVFEMDGHKIGGPL